MSRSKNGTARNNTSTQTVAQRNAYANTFDGPSMGQKRVLYGFSTSPNPVDIMTNAINNLNEFVIPPSENPDFNGGIQDGRLNTFSQGANKFSDVANAKDLPNRLGPNVKALDVKDPPLTDVSSPVAGHVKISSPTNDGETAGDAGFGVYIDRNDPNADPTVTPYLERRGAFQGAVGGNYQRGQGTKLGEYLDSSIYEYTE